MEIRFQFGESDTFSSSGEESLSQNLENLENLENLHQTQNLEAETNLQNLDLEARTTLESLTTDLTEEEKSLALQELERELAKVSLPENNNNSELLKLRQEQVDLQRNQAKLDQQVIQENQIVIEKEEKERQTERQARNRAETEAQKEEIPEQPRKVKLKRLLKKVIVTGKESQALTSQESNQESQALTSRVLNPEIVNRPEPENQVNPSTKRSQELENQVLIERIKLLVSQLDESPNRGM